MSESDRAMVTDWVNTAAICPHASERVELLHKIHEFVIQKANWLLPELLPDVVAFAADRNGDVKRCVVGFIEEACKKNEQNIPKVVMNLHMLLCDESVQVQKRVIQASSSIYRNMISWLSRAQVVTEEMEQAWNALNRIKVEIVNMIDSDNDGVRTHSIKFLEGVVLLQTYPEPGISRKENDFSLEDIPLTLKIARRRKLEEEANHIFSLLIKFHGSPHISSVNLMACMGSLCTIAKLRSDFFPRVLTALEHLLANLPPTLSDSQVSSVRKHLKLQLVNVLKHPGLTALSVVQEHRSTIVNVLTDLSCSQQEIIRLVPKIEEKKRTGKRNQDMTGQQQVKKARLDLDTKIEDAERQRRQAIDLNQQFIMDNLNLNAATTIVCAMLKNVPNVMPSQFSLEYGRIFNSGSSVIVKDIAKLLAEQFTDAEVGPGASKLMSEVPQVTVMQDTPMEISSVVKDSDPDSKSEKPSKQARTRPRIKTLKLAEVTRPLSPETRTSQILAAVGRMLRSERAAARVGASHTRYKILTTLAASFGPAVRQEVLGFVLSDLRAHMDLALAWLYEEYSVMQGFRRADMSGARSEQSYGELLCALAQALLQGGPELRERDGLLARLFLEAPLLTDDALLLLRQQCTRVEKCVPALNLLHDLVIRRPPRGRAYLDTLLGFTTFEDITIRSESISRGVSLYERTEWQGHIEQHALNYLEMLTLGKPPDTLFGEETGRLHPTSGWNDDLYRVCLSLYLALLPYNESLIHELARVYTQTGAGAKRVILRLLEAPVRGMGLASPELLHLVEQCPKGAETLVTRVIHVLSERGPPSPQLVSRVRELYQSRVSDVRFLIPVLNGLTKKEVIAALPKLIKLNPVVVKEVFNRLLGAHGDSPISPSELLIALHCIDPAKAELKAVMKSTSLCFAEKQVYTQEVLAVVMQQLLELNPLPTLLMRTVIQSLTLYPRLTGFVMNVLQRLILKQVWRQKVVWEGFIKCCQRTRPQSFQVLLQLPPPQLAEALTVCPDMRQPLVEHVQALSEAQRAHVPASTMDVLLGQTQTPPPAPGTTTPGTLTPGTLTPSAVVGAASVSDDGLDVKNDLEAGDEPLPPGMD